MRGKGKRGRIEGERERGIGRGREGGREGERERERERSFIICIHTPEPGVAVHTSISVLSLNFPVVIVEWL